LAKSGYFGGDPHRVLHSPIDIVMNVIHFERFEYDYELAQDALISEGEQ